MSGVRSMQVHLERYFFAPESPDTLGYARVAFFLWLLLFYLPIAEGYPSQNVAAFADLGEVFWQPVFPFGVLGGPLPHPWIDALVALWKLLLLGSCIGLFSRASMLGACVLGFYLLGLPFNFGKVSHNTGPLAIALVILALSRAGDAVSVDAWRRRRRGDPRPVASGEYRWPLRYLWVLLALVYFCAGASKWLGPGLDYLDPDTMAGFLMQRSFAWSNPPLTDWGYTVAQSPWLCSAMGAGALLGESGFFLALFFRPARWVLLPALFFGHIGIAMLLGPQFFQFMALYVFWVPWGAWAARLRELAPRRA